VNFDQGSKEGDSGNAPQTLGSKEKVDGNKNN
jgi:hypothetical protein